MTETNSSVNSVDRPASAPPNNSSSSIQPPEPPHPNSSSLSWFRRGLPTAAVLALLGILAVWGHATGWTIPKYSELTGGDDWKRIEIPADKVPRIKPQFLEQERRALGESPISAW
jgi:hypothetical protein